MSLASPERSRSTTAKLRSSTLTLRCFASALRPLALTTDAAVRVSFGSLMVQRDKWDTYWGPKKIFFLIRDIDDATMAGASVESCQSLPKRSPWGRLGSVLYTCKRLHRMRQRFKHFWSISLNKSAHWTINSLAMASTALGAH